MIPYLHSMFAGKMGEMGLPGLKGKDGERNYLIQCRK